jgi:hypothetical protein
METGELGKRSQNRFKNGRMNNECKKIYRLIT